jgi:uncharacterized protein
MVNNQFPLIESFILSKLRSRLSPALTYHGVHHTMDVLEQAIRIAESEHIRDEEELFILKTAALYHDSGFLNTYSGHEEEGCKIASADLPSFGVNSSQIIRIAHLIMATQIPQLPSDKLEEVICDADLDYLGRDDFFPIAQTLFDEWKKYGIVNNEREWNGIQLKFIESHHYFTETSRSLRTEKKLQNLEIIRSRLNASA